MEQIGAGAEANIQQEQSFDQFTQEEQIAILHSQVDGLRTSFGWITESLIQQAGALQCAMGILKQLKPEWTIKAVAVPGGETKWIVVDEAGKPVEGIFKEAENREGKTAPEA